MVFVYTGLYGGGVVVLQNCSIARLCLYVLPNYKEKSLTSDYQGFKIKEVRIKGAVVN